MYKFMFLILLVFSLFCWNHAHVVRRAAEVNSNETAYHGTKNETEAGGNINNPHGGSDSGGASNVNVPVDTSELDQVDESAGKNMQTKDPGADAVLNKPTLPAAPETTTAESDNNVKLNISSLVNAGAGTRPSLRGDDDKSDVLSNTSKAAFLTTTTEIGNDAKQNKTIDALNSIELPSIRNSNSSGAHISGPEPDEGGISLEQITKTSIEANNVDAKLKETNGKGGEESGKNLSVISLPGTTTATTLEFVAPQSASSSDRPDVLMQSDPATKNLENTPRSSTTTLSAAVKQPSKNTSDDVDSKPPPNIGDNHIDGNSENNAILSSTTRPTTTTTEVLATQPSLDNDKLIHQPPTMPDADEGSSTTFKKQKRLRTTTLPLDNDVDTLTSTAYSYEDFEAKGLYDDGDDDDDDDGDVNQADIDKPPKVNSKKPGGSVKQRKGTGKPKAESSSSSFMVYFLVVAALVAGFYVVYHNRQKLKGLLIEGRQGLNRRRTSRGAYNKLSSKGDDILPSPRESESVHSYVY